MQTVNALYLQLLEMQRAFISTTCTSDMLPLRRSYKNYNQNTPISLQHYCSLGWCQISVGRRPPRTTILIFNLTCISLPQTPSLSILKRTLFLLSVAWNVISLLPLLTRMILFSFTTWQRKRLR